MLFGLRRGVREGFAENTFSQKFGGGDCCGGDALGWCVGAQAPAGQTPAAQAPVAQGSAAQGSVAQTPAVQTPAAVQPVGRVQPAGAVQTPAVALTAAAQGGTITGRVVAGRRGRAGGVPLPGVAMTATNTLTGKKYATTTDVDGAFAMTIPRNGRYVVRAELAAFASATQEVVLNGVEAEGGGKQGDHGWSGGGLSGCSWRARVAAAEAKQTAGAGGGAGTASQRGDAGAEPERGRRRSDATDAARGMRARRCLRWRGWGDDGGGFGDGERSMGQTNGLANFSEDEIRQRVQDAVAQARASGVLRGGGDLTNAIVGVLGGMMGGGGVDLAGRTWRCGGGGGGGFGGGAFRNFNPTQPHGSIFYQTSNGALNSAQWSPTLQPQTKPSSYTNKLWCDACGVAVYSGTDEAEYEAVHVLQRDGAEESECDSGWAVAGADGAGARGGFFAVDAGGERCDDAGDDLRSGDGAGGCGE